MSDFSLSERRQEPNWWELSPDENPSPDQIAALALIRDEAQGTEILHRDDFNPYNVAEKLSSRADVTQKLMEEKPQALLDAVEAIAKSEAAHAKRALATGAAGVFLAIANAQDSVMTREQYRKFSEPFDRMVLRRQAERLSTRCTCTATAFGWISFWKGWPEAAINYDGHGTGVSSAQAREKSGGVLMGGLDRHEGQTGRRRAAIEKMIENAKVAAPKWICTPGCSVPDDTSDANCPDPRGLRQATKTEVRAKEDPAWKCGQPGGVYFSPLKQGLEIHDTGEVLGFEACAPTNAPSMSG